MIQPLKDVPRATRERQRLIYHDLTLTMAQIAERLGVSQSGVYARASAWGWAGRRAVAIGAGRKVGGAGSDHDAPVSAPAGPALTPPDQVAAGEGYAGEAPAGEEHDGAEPGRKRPYRRGPMSDRDRAALASDMERFVADRIAALKRDAACGRDQDGERTAREITHYTRSLTTLRGYRGTLPGDDAAGTPGGDPPRDLGELRDELRRHLERIWAEERSSRLRGGPDAP